MLQAAAVVRTSVEDGALILRTDPQRLARAGDGSPPSHIIAALQAEWPAFAELYRGLAARRGHVRVHRGLVALRVSDAGLSAILLRRFVASARELGGEYLALPEALKEDLLACVKKEGFVARRCP